MRRYGRRSRSGGGYTPHYVPGDYKRICDISGFLVKASETRWQWNNLIARIEDWTPRNPQDFVRGVADRQFVPDPRPEPTTDTFANLPRYLIAKSSGSGSANGSGTSS